MFDFKSVLSNLGSDAVLTLKSFVTFVVNDLPGEYLNDIPLGISETVNVPLYPLFAAPTGLSDDVIFLIVILSLTLKLCGFSTETVTFVVPPS